MSVCISRAHQHDFGSAVVNPEGFLSSLDPFLTVSILKKGILLLSSSSIVKPTDGSISFNVERKSEAFVALGILPRVPST